MNSTGDRVSGGFQLGALIAAAALLAGCTAVGPYPNDVAELARWMSGTFSSHAQSQEQPADFLDIRLVMTPIWSERTDGAWLYVEQAAASSVERPYRQRVYHLTQRYDGAIVSDVFTLPGDALRFAGAWMRADGFAGLSPSQLEPRTGCSITLRREGGSWVGATDGTSCPSEREGASYATSEAVVRPHSIESWDRGYDAQGAQVWGSSAGPYRFAKSSDTPPGTAFNRSERTR